MHFAGPGAALLLDPTSPSCCLRSWLACVWFFKGLDATFQWDCQAGLQLHGRTNCSEQVDEPEMGQASGVSEVFRGSALAALAG